MHSLTHVPFIKSDSTVQWDKQVFCQDFFLPYLKTILEENSFTFERLNHGLQNICIRLESEISTQFEKIIDVFGSTLKLNSDFALGAIESKDKPTHYVSAANICDRVYERLAKITNIINSLKLSKQKLLRDEFSKLPEGFANTLFQPSLCQDVDLESTKKIVAQLLNSARPNERAVIASAIEAIMGDESSPDNISFDSYLAIERCCETLKLSAVTRKNLFNTLQKPIRLPDLQMFTRYCFAPEPSVVELRVLLEDAARQAPFRAIKFFNILHNSLSASGNERNDKIMFNIACNASVFQVSKLAFDKLRNPELKKSVIRIFLSRNKYYQHATTLDKYKFKSQDCNIVHYDQSNLTELGKKEDVIEFLESNTFQGDKNLFVKLSELIHKNEVEMAVNLISGYSTEHMKGLFLLEQSAIQKFIDYFLENQNLDMAASVLSLNLPNMEYLRNNIYGKQMAVAYVKKGEHSKAYQIMELATEPTKSWIKFLLDQLIRRSVDAHL